MLIFSLIHQVQRVERQKLLKREKRVLGDHDVPLFQYDATEYDRDGGVLDRRAFLGSDDFSVDSTVKRADKDPGIKLIDPRFNRQWYLVGIDVFMCRIVLDDFKE